MMMVTDDGKIFESRWKTQKQKLPRKCTVPNLTLCKCDSFKVQVPASAFRRSQSVTCRHLSLSGGRQAPGPPVQHHDASLVFEPFGLRLGMREVGFSSTELGSVSI